MITASLPSTLHRNIIREIDYTPNVHISYVAYVRVCHYEIGVRGLTRTGYFVPGRDVTEA